MPNLTREQIVSASEDLGHVEVPEWAESLGIEIDPDDPPTVLVRGLDAAYIQSMIAGGFIDERGAADITKLDFTEIAARSLVDENNERMFVNSKQIKLMGEKSFSVISRIAKKSLDLSGLSPEDEDEDEEKKA